MLEAEVPRGAVFLKKGKGKGGSTGGSGECRGQGGMEVINIEVFAEKGPSRRELARGPGDGGVADPKASLAQRQEKLCGLVGGELGVHNALDSVR